MTLDLRPGNGDSLPERAGRRVVGSSGLPTLGAAMAALKQPTLEERIAWAQQTGFGGVELLADGAPWGLHAPSVARDARERLRLRLDAFDALAVQAPHQATFDLTLVSPSAAIRRASVTEIWSVCRFVQALGGGIVLVRTGTPPSGVDRERAHKHLAESLFTLDRMAGDHGVTLGLLSRDLLASPEAFRNLRLLGLPHTGIALDLEDAKGAISAWNVVLRDMAEKTLYARIPADLPVPDEDTLAHTLLTETHFAGMLCLTAGGEADAAAALASARTRWNARLRRRAIPPANGKQP